MCRLDVKKYETIADLETLVLEFRNYFIVKRMFDVACSLIILILLAPGLIIVSLFVKLDGTNGTVFFTQERMGINGTVFKMYKFRSMVPNAENILGKIEHLNESEGNMFKIKEDPRLTKIGKVLRAYSIDEIPQFINVLKGDMSIIGPRPCLLTEYANFTDYDKSRLVVKPGMTGLWQVSGRSSLSFTEMIELDLQYIQSLSLKMELYIFVRTFLVVLKKENAC